MPLGYKTEFHPTSPLSPNDEQLRSKRELLIVLALRDKLVSELEGFVMEGDRYDEIQVDGRTVEFFDAGAMISKVRDIDFAQDLLRQKLLDVCVAYKLPAPRVPQKPLNQGEVLRNPHVAVRFADERNAEPTEVLELAHRRAVAEAGAAIREAASRGFEAMVHGPKRALKMIEEGHPGAPPT